MQFQFLTQPLSSLEYSEWPSTPKCKIYRFSMKKLAKKQFAGERLKQATKEEQEQICKKYGFKQDTQKIDLSYKHLGDSGTEDIAKFLAFSSKIKHINLKSNSLGKLASEYLCEALKINKSLEILELQSNELGKDGAAFLFYTLNQNSLNLKELNLEFNSIGSEGGDLISQYLKNMKTQLVKFSLGSNELRDSAILEIIKILTNYELNKSIQEVKLHYNEVSDECAAYICEVFEDLIVKHQPQKSPQNKKSLDKNNKVQNSLKGNNNSSNATDISSKLTLKSLDLSMNQFSNKMEMRLDKLMKSCLKSYKI
eukprot:403371509